jgi:hypothetical protein
MSGHENPAVDFDIGDVCARFSVLYTGAISDVLDEMGYRKQVLPWEIQGLTGRTPRGRCRHAARGSIYRDRRP